MPYDYRPYPFTPPQGLHSPEPRKDVVIVGAGPIGLALALELANHGTRSVVLDDNNVVSVGSRAICWSKRSLEILDRIGIGEACLRKGVTWQIGRTFHRDQEIFSFDLLPEDGHKMPAFVNLQQYYVEEYLADAALAHPLIDLRFKNRVAAIDYYPDHVFLDIETPGGEYALEADWLVACDGARSPIRNMMGLEFDGELFEERFLIADIEMQADFPSERRFWFEPTFHHGQSALLHKQPDDIYRIDLQLGWDSDPELEKQPDRVTKRIEKVVGHTDFRLDWVSVYTFHCRRLERFVHGRVVFAGDSAHVVSPFGARGGNGGLQDVDALGWRLAGVVQGRGTETILADYDRERQFGADENILNSTRATKFMTPEEGTERLFRDQILAL
ncbi:MAG: FAD-dependent monooxygenase, partial [Pseudomonadota bacterium]